jgi:hypothetical protein
VGQEDAPDRPSPQAQTLEPRDQLGEHVVQPGETLEAITERYLGTPVLWRDNWKLNPELRDPHLIRPGQVLRVIVERQMPARRAEIVEIAPRVDEKRVAEPDWQTAEVGSVLLEGDGVRTFEQASAELELDDRSRVVVTERSMVFLRRMETTLTRVASDTIEVLEGQADLEARVLQPRTREIEIVVGGAVARPAPDAIGRVQNRARRAEAGGAELMVYTGRSEVEAGGGTVSVPEGMGTRVPEGEPPRPPEPLLPAPRPTSPAAGSRWDYANPRFSWQAVDGAASYTLEVCGDAACAQLVARAVGLAELAWPSERLPAAALFWRVTALSPSGLDGYPSRPVAFRITADRVDAAPPAAAVRLVGAGRQRGERAFLLGRGGRVGLAVTDDASGVAAVRLRWDGGGWEEAGSGSGVLLAPPGAGEHTLEIEATDHLERTSQTRIAVEADLTPPPPPRLTGERAVVPEPAASAMLAGASPAAVAACVEGPCEWPGNGVLRLGTGARLWLEAPGGAPLRYRWDGGPWQGWAATPLAPPAPGSHVLELEALGPDGKGSGVRSLRVESPETG